MRDRDADRHRDEAGDAGQREIFWRRYEEGIERLRQDPRAWADYAGEREAEADALRDGLEPECPQERPVSG